MIRISADHYLIALSWVFILCLMPIAITAQKWQNLQTYGGPGNENPGDLSCRESGDCALGFTFQRQIDINGLRLNSRGGSDFVILQRKAGDTQYRYFTHGGGPLDEELVSVRPRKNGGMLCAGMFWNELVLPDTTLRAKDGGKAIFLNAYRADGRLEWAKVINGSGLKAVQDLVLSESGLIWLGGYFGDSLFVESKTWKADGETDALVMNFESNGTLRWLRHHGTRGSTRAIGLAELPGLVIAAVGYFDEVARFDQEVLNANTNDQDLFFAAWAPDGQLRWVRKAGGVFDATPVDIASDAKGNLYFCGNIVGVIRFDGGLSIQSRDGNSDLFVGAMDMRGAPLWARVYSGDQVQECSHLLLHQNKIYLSGFTLGNFNFGGQSINPSDRFSSFLGVLDSLGLPQSASILDADGGLFTSGLAFGAPGSALQLAGVYRGSGNLGDLSLPFSTGFDFFTAEFSNLTTGVPGFLINNRNFSVFPIPTQNKLYIQNQETGTYSAVLIDAFGRQIQEKANSPDQLDLLQVPAGLYFLQIRQKNTWSIYKIIKH